MRPNTLNGTRFKTSTLNWITIGFASSFMLGCALSAFVMIGLFQKITNFWAYGLIAYDIITLLGTLGSMAVYRGAQDTELMRLAALLGKEKAVAAVLKKPAGGLRGSNT